MPAPDVAALLAELERAAPEVAEPARVAVEWLTGGEALETISQLDVCEFLWYTLPLKISGSGEHAVIADALGQLLRLGGMERYAALCVAPVTVEILRTYAEEGEEAGALAYHHALEGTGVLPPDVEELSWSSIMGPEELGAHVACAAALELALVSGVGTGREALTRRWLTEPRAELGGDCWLHRVHGERLNRWVLGRGNARRELAQPFEVRLHAPVPVPGGQVLEPLRWLLDMDRIPLTARFNLARALVVEATARYGWEVMTMGAPRSEAEVPALVTLRTIAIQELGALERTGRRLGRTPDGDALLADRTRLWEAATATLLTPGAGEHDFEVSVREAALMLLADGTPLRTDDLRRRVAEVVNGEGWRNAFGGPVSSLDLAVPLAELQRRLDAFNLRVSCARKAPWQLSATGQAAALAALRAQALRPRQYAGI
jgi:hypothetical protein